MGQYAELVQVCEERLGERPNSPMALWWSARAHFELEHYPFARERFARLLRIEPGWRDHVAPYMEKLQGRTHNVQ